MSCGPGATLKAFDRTTQYTGRLVWCQNCEALLHAGVSLNISIYIFYVHLQECGQLELFIGKHQKEHNSGI